MKLRTSLLLTLPLVMAIAGCTAVGPMKLAASYGGVFGDPDKMINTSPFLRPGLPPPAPPPAMTCTPAPCALPNVDASAGTTMAINETPIAVNPLNPKQMITGSNDWNCNGRFLGFWTSGSGGKRWSGGCVQSLQGASLAGDPIAGYDLNGTLYQGGVDLNSNGVVVVASSTDNGQTWSNPVVAINFPNQLADKPWLAIDTNANSPNRNNLYISNTMYGEGTTIYVTTSKDGGQTWNSVAVSGHAFFPEINQLSDLAIGSDGTVYLTYLHCTTAGNTGDCGGTVGTMYFQKSADAGTTWSAPAAVDTPTLAPHCSNQHSLFGCLPNTTMIVSNIPSIGVDNSGGKHDGNLYVCDYNWAGSYMQVQVKTSTDGGSTWSAPAPVAPNTDTHDQFFQWLSVAPDGKVGVTWMDRRNDPANISYEAFGTWSSDGGKTFNTHNIQIGKKSSNPSNNGLSPAFLGDYAGNAWAGSKKLIASWADTRNGSYAQDYIGGLQLQ